MVVLNMDLLSSHKLSLIFPRSQRPRWHSLFRNRSLLPNTFLASAVLFPLGAGGGRRICGPEGGNHERLLTMLVAFLRWLPHMQAWNWTPTRS